MTDGSTSLASHLSQLFCPAPPTKGLTKEQMAALHEFKHELMNSLHKLYQVVPETEADKIVKEFVDKLP